jgi:hypothetical protein
MDTRGEPESEVARLLRELEAAELYEQQLRQTIVGVRDENSLRGHVERALSMLNAALNDIDSATDVVVPHKARVSTAGEIQRERRADSTPTARYTHTAEARAQQQIGEWIVSASLAGTHGIEVVAGIGERLNAAGVPVARRFRGHRLARSDVRWTRRSLASRRRRNRGDRSFATSTAPSSTRTSGEARSAI